jgi:membrane protease YdiL (CAAX protease family)
VPELREFVALALSWLLLAGIGAAIALLLRTFAAAADRHLPPQRRRAVVWTGPLVGAAFVVFILLPEFILPYIDRAALARRMYGTDVDPATAASLARCIADLIGLPLMLGAWAGMLALAGARPTLSGSAARLTTNYLVGYWTWLVLTPAVYAVSFAAQFAYALIVHERPENHPIVRALLTGQAPAGVVAALAAQAVVAAPVKEELFFRGVVQPWLATKSWGGDVAVFLAAVLGLMIHAPAGIPWTDPLAAAGAAAPVLFVFAVLPLYRLMDWWDLSGWLPVRDPEARRRAARAIVGTALLFANFHANVWPTPVPLFVLALGLGWLAYRTQGVAAPIVLHMLFNAIVFAALRFAPPAVPG